MSWWAFVSSGPESFRHLSSTPAGLPGARDLRPHRGGALASRRDHRPRPRHHVLRHPHRPGHVLRPARPLRRGRRHHHRHRQLLRLLGQRRPGTEGRARRSSATGCATTRACASGSPSRPRWASSRCDGGGVEGLGAETVRREAEPQPGAAGRRRIDLYWAHGEDRRTPIEETTEAIGELVATGTVGRRRHLQPPHLAGRASPRPRLARRARAPSSALQLTTSYVEPRPGAAVEGKDHRFGWVTDETRDYLERNDGIELWAYSPLVQGSFDRDDRPFPQAYDHPGTTAPAGGAHRGRGRARRRPQPGRAGLAPAARRRVRPIVGVSSLEQLEPALAAGGAGPRRRDHGPPGSACVGVDLAEDPRLHVLRGEGRPHGRRAQVGDAALVEAQQVGGDRRTRALSVVPNIGGSSELIVTGTPASTNARSGCSASVATARVAMLDDGHTSSGIPSLGEVRRAAPGRRPTTCRGRSARRRAAARRPRRSPGRWSPPRAAPSAGPRRGPRRSAAGTAAGARRSPGRRGRSRPAPSGRGRARRPASRRRPGSRTRRGCRRSSAAPARSRARPRPGRPRWPRCRPRSACRCRRVGRTEVYGVQVSSAYRRRCSPPSRGRPRRSASARPPGCG